jgi:hypothetical protein
VSVLIDIPVRAAGVPHRSRECGAQLFVEAVGDLLTNLDPPGVDLLEN